VNLITEYQKRHSTCSIPLCHDGVCFFEHNGQPALIVLTSLSCRCWTTCPQCEVDKNPNVIVEFFVPGSAGAFYISGHHHVDPCTDLLKCMDKIGFRGYVPYYAPKPRDCETWLWRFTTQNSRFRGLKVVETDQQLKLVEQMVHAVQKHPKLYQAYYVAHEVFLHQRKYMLFGE
jgi:hypothetical protein